MLGRLAFRPVRAASKSRHGLTTHLRCFRGDKLKINGPHSTWQLQTLAIETSCDDTSVAVLAISGEGCERRDDLKLRTKVLFHEKITANSADYGGIHPIVALESHQRELAPLVEKAMSSLNDPFSVHTEHASVVDGIKGRTPRRLDFVTVTRGPGMRSNLSVGLELAKGLALAFNVPLLGVHHMQAHALTSRLCWTLGNAGDRTTIMTRPNQDAYEGTEWRAKALQPRFPFLSVLASGGHTMLISSESLTSHKTLAETADIALGDCLDKAARAILHSSELKAPYGKALEDFVFPANEDHDTGHRYDYSPPVRRQEELESRITKWGWSIRPPLAESKGGEKSSRRMVYSFAGLLTSVQRLMEGEGGAARCIEERRELAREVMRVAFEHLTSRILLHFDSLTSEQRSGISTVVVSGGVASNTFLRHVLRSTLDARGLSHVKLDFPPVELCTDNALMIAWVGMEMYDAGYESELGIGAIRKWSLDPSAEDGGILGVGGWKKDGKPVGENADGGKEAEDGKGGDQGSTETLGAEVVTFSISLLLMGGFVYGVIRLCSPRKSKTPEKGVHQCSTEENTEENAWFPWKLKQSDEKEVLGSTEEHSWWHGWFWK